MTNDQTKVLLHMAEHCDSWWSPTKLGELVGKKDYQQSSSWGSSQAKALVNLGFAERSPKGHYRITDDGKNAAAALKEAGA